MSLTVFVFALLVAAGCGGATPVEQSDAPATSEGPQSSSTTPSTQAQPDDRSAVLAAAALDRATVRNSLSGAVPADLYVIDRLGVVGPQLWPDPRQPGALVLTEADRGAVEAAFAPKEVRWVSPDEWDSLVLDLAGPSAGEPPLLVTLAEPVIDGDRATVVTNVWCGLLCGMGGGLVVERQADGTWLVTGTDGSQWIS